ncbi:MAG: hypothetical protein GX442_25525 [Candidatus Riflebacteria bacterium]|nr:hypothetical protein [Candidatus Riflebacteria bacterium]
MSEGIPGSVGIPSSNPESSPGGPGPDSLITSTGQDGLWRWRVEPSRVVRDRQVCPHRFDGPIVFSPDRKTLGTGARLPLFAPSSAPGS